MEANMAGADLRWQDFLGPRQVVMPALYGS